MMTANLNNNKMKKRDLPSRDAAQLIEAGSNVMCVDGSYIVSLFKNSNKLEYNTQLGKSDDIFTVVAINVPCPQSEKEKFLGEDYLHPTNNCIIKNSKGDIHFVSYINIRNTESL